jgi:hypothetical protein
VLTGNDDATIKAILRADLKDSFRSDNPDIRSSIDKSITILLKVWLKTPAGLESLRIDGLDLLKHLPLHDHIAVHWGMLMAVYPFWASVALQTGRLLRLQGSATATQVQRRIREQYGERETVSRRARYVLRSYVDWGVLSETGTKGIYNASPALDVDDSRLIAWLVEASLHARANSSTPLKDLIDSPSLFPFRLKPIHAESLRVASASIEVLRHGLDDDMVILRRKRTEGKRENNPFVLS